MRVIVSGASGLVGTALTTVLRAEGHTVLRLVRGGKAQSPADIRWYPHSAQIDVPAMEAADVVVHLSGANISARRWTANRKQVLRSSRIDSTRVLVDSLARLRQKPSVFIGASAVGYYGNRRGEILTEASESGHDFLSLLARDWEAEEIRAAEAGIRTVILRLGVILARDGGALPQIARPFRFGVGGRLGSGAQWMSWIALEDALSIIRFSISNSALSGPVNAVAPQPLQNADFTRIVGQVLHRPAILPVPAFALRLALGEMADAVLLASQRAVPTRLLEARYSFRFYDLESTLRTMLAR